MIPVIARITVARIPVTWIPAYWFYHLTLSAFLTGFVSQHSIKQVLVQNSSNRKHLLYSALISSANFIVIGYCVYLFSSYCTASNAYMFPKLGACVVLADVWFYSTHKLLHHPTLFKHIHVIHHQWTSPLPFVAYYSHPIENLISNLGSVIFPLLLVDPSELLLHTWIVFAITQSTIAHAGVLRWPFPTSNHDQHHKKFNGDYGINLFMDKMLE